MIWRISECVNWAKTISGCDTIFDFHVKIDMFVFFNFSTFFIKRLRQKRHLSNMFSRKCQVQNDRINLEKIECFRQHLDFTMYFTIKTSIFKLWPLFRFLCLINSFYRSYVSCVYTISNISNISPIYPIYFVYSIHSIHSVIRSYVLGFLSYFPCRISSSHRVIIMKNNAQHNEVW